jgi:hypothetical protein
MTSPLLSFGYLFRSTGRFQSMFVISAEKASTQNQHTKRTNAYKAHDRLHDRTQLGSEPTNASQ